eukprot:TRINITY_DN5338_c0_g4_i1.p2 TRINITY_DN5338_c0_g4~~TRINITY_DN5338_c0_g4_i1.p2  ORF type:complete len:155 (-),score=9.87 TRINITY_DN5338_c0_g4_i1:47-511(-)
MQVAASNAVLPNCKWLLAQGCPHDSNDICEEMALSGCPGPLMAWVRSCGGGDWTPQGMTGMLATALLHSTPVLVHWLRAAGAHWPEDLAEVVTIKVHELSPSTILWAVQQGCPFGRWTSQVCEWLDDNHNDGGTVRRTLHDLGCPCACPRPYKV